jgi:hypothetical protein
MVLGLSFFTPIVSIVVIGLSFSLVPAALWPSIPRIVDEENIATAYGMMVRHSSITHLLHPPHDTFAYAVLHILYRRQFKTPASR